MEKQDIARRIWQEFEPELHAAGYELVDVEFTGPGGILRIFIDKEGGITLDDCTAASKMLGPLLDMGDFIGEHYLLEVSSPGIDRPLRKPADFERFTGEEVRVLTHAASNGRRKYTGMLKGYNDGLISVECDGKVFEVHLENLKKANLNR